MTESNLDIWGVLLATLSTGNASSNQVIYICENARGLYLSESVRRDLGCISQGFPNDSITSCSTLTSLQEECSCQRRSATPKRPSQIPFPPTEANAKLIEEWILDYYKSSVLNTCEHQPLPQMTGSPITIHFQLIPNLVLIIAPYQFHITGKKK